jgi:hypothetical protein
MNFSAAVQVIEIGPDRRALLPGEFTFLCKTEKSGRNKKEPAAHPEGWAAGSA